MTNKARVLLVDDHPITRAGMRAVIAAQPGFEVCGETAFAAEALTLAVDARPDIAVVDVNLPRANGIDLTRELQARAPDVPILVVSMHDESSYAERALRAGARGYLMKQEAGDRFVSALQQVLRGDVFLSPRMQERLTRRILPKRKHEQFPIDTLSEREREVFDLIGEGFSTKQIAERLALSSKTVDSYRDHLKLKLGLDSGAELVRHAIMWGQTPERS